MLHVDHRVYPCIVGNRVTVGHSVVLHGCVVEDDALIGIGAIVLNGATHSHGRDCGGPARVAGRYGCARAHAGDGHARKK